MMERIMEKFNRRILHKIALLHSSYAIMIILTENIAV